MSGQGGDLLHEAEVLSAYAHRGQVDKADRDYWTSHVNDVAERLPHDDEAAQIVAQLHDVLEDTRLTERELLGTFAPHIVDAVKAITHRQHEPRADYYARVKANPLALRVKLADIASNTDPARMALLDEATRVRLTEKYRKALEALA